MATGDLAVDPLMKHRHLLAMGIILDSWQSRATENRITPILPDGCRDLIFCHRRGQHPIWFISALQTGAKNSRMGQGDHMVGFRIAPGTAIEEASLLRTLGHMDPDPARTGEILGDHSHRHPDVTAILAHLAHHRGTVAMAARDLNIHPRQLHRLLTKTAGRGPAFWLQLARVRSAGREVLTGKSHAGIAIEYGYADQSHMVRDMQKWFAHSPTSLPRDASFTGQLSSGGFA